MSSSVPPLPGQLELVRPPAPGALELVRRFINSYERTGNADALATPEKLVAWLREEGLIERRAVATSADVVRARELRAALLALARHNNACESVCEPAAATLDDASTRSRFAMAFDPATGTSALRPLAGGIDGALGRLVAAVHVAMLERTWARLKACADDTCAWAYYDHSKNGCSRWCADSCGNRSKVKRFRERKAQGTRSGR